MGQLESDIRGKLNLRFAPNELNVVNESSMHAVPAGSETHFKVLIVSEAFEGLSRVARQQMVYKELADEFRLRSLHALSLRALTPEEHAKETDGSFESPACHGRKG